MKATEAKELSEKAEKEASDRDLKDLEIVFDKIKRAANEGRRSIKPGYVTPRQKTVLLGLGYIFSTETEFDQRQGDYEVTVIKW